MKLVNIFILLVIFLTFSACDSNSHSTESFNNNKSSLRGKTMGTRYNIIIIHPKDVKLNKESLKAKIDSMLIDLNQQISTYIDYSQISQFNQANITSWIKVDKNFYSIAESAQHISKLSNGSFDTTIFPLIDLWGFGAKKRKELPNKEQIELAISDSGYQKLQLNHKNHSIKKLHPNLRIDYSAIAKGFAVDIISDYLKAQNLNNHLVEIGGELKASGFNQADQKWRIAIEQPDLSVSATQNGLEISNRAVATSGDYRNYFVEKGIRRSHIIDPKTGYPINHNLASVTVIHESAMLADGYATAILVLGEVFGKEFAKENKIDVLMVIRKDEKFEFWSSPGLFK